MPSASSSWDPSKRFLAALVAGLALLLGLGLGGAAGGRRVKAWRVERFLAQAEDALGRKQWDHAAGILQAAYALAPDEPKVVRAAARYYGLFRNPAGLVQWEQLEKMGAATDEDRLQHAQLALFNQRPDQAIASVRRLHQGSPTNHAYLLLVSELLEQQGDLAQATAAALQALTVSGDAPESALRVGQLGLAGKTEAQRYSGKARLLALLSAPAPWRVDAALMLLASGQTVDAEIRLIESLIPSTGPTATPGDGLIHLLLRLKREPLRHAEWVGEFLRRFGLTADSPAFAFAAEALFDTGNPLAVLDLIPAPAVVANAHLSRLRAGALAATKNIPELDSLLTNPATVLAQHQRSLFRACAATLAGRTNETAILWRRALADAGGHVPALKQVAHNAELLGHPDMAIQAWENLMTHPATAERAGREVLRLAEQRRNLIAIHGALKRLQNLAPEQARMKLMLAFSQLLLEVEQAQARATLAELKTSNAHDPFYQIAAGLNALRQERPEVALQHLDHDSIDWTRAPSTWRVVRAAAEGRMGDNTRARDLLSSLNPDHLSAQEFALVKPWLPAKRSP